jgi:phosphocarrier protein
VIVPSAPPDAPSSGGAAKWARAVVTIVNRRGLHARAATKFVKVAEQFVAEIEVVKDDMAVSGTSIMGLMVLAAALDTQLEIRARGREAEPALAALVALVERGLDET